MASRGTLIDRRHYGRRLGISAARAGQLFKHIFAEYERRYNIVTGPLAKLEAVRAWLEAAYRNGDLNIRDGKIDRTACVKHFRLNPNSLARYPEYRALFEEFDRRVVENNYLPRKYKLELQRATNWLNNAPVLNSDRLTVNRHELARAIEVNISRLKDKAFTEIIAAADARILRKASASQIDPCFHGRVYPFSGLKGAWPPAFLEKVGARFKTTHSGSTRESAKQLYLQLLNALEWIGNSKDPACRKVVAETRAKGRVLSQRDWEEALYLYRNDLVEQYKSGKATIVLIDNKITALRSTLDALASGQIVPSLSAPLQGVKDAKKRSGGHRRSVAEAGQRKSAGRVHRSHRRLSEIRPRKIRNRVSIQWKSFGRW